MVLYGSCPSWLLFWNCCPHRGLWYMSVFGYGYTRQSGTSALPYLAWPGYHTITILLHQCGFLAIMWELGPAGADWEWYDSFRPGLQAAPSFHQLEWHQTVTQSLRLLFPLQGHGLLGAGLLSPYGGITRFKRFLSYLCKESILHAKIIEVNACIYQPPFSTIKNYEIKTNLLYL